jgi:iron complex outermembrane recepter protein
MAGISVNSSLSWAAVGTVLLASSPSFSQTAPDFRASSQVGALEEIVVTATRREETLNNVPISVTAFDSAKLDAQGAVSVDDIMRLTPGVTFSRSGFVNNSDINIRGIDSTVGSSTTGVYVDDTPVQVRSLGFAGANLYPENFDLQRVEVLRGPQGTLFGAGSEGGTVRFITTQPGLEQYSSYIRADESFTKGGDPNSEVGAAFGGPIKQDLLGFRVSAWTRRQGGYIDRVSPVDGSLVTKNTNSENDYAFRVALRFQPVDAVDATLSSYYQSQNINNASYYFPRFSNPSGGEFNSADPFGSPSRDTWVLTALTVQAKLGTAFTLTSVTSDLTRKDTPDQDYSTVMPPILFGPRIFDNQSVVPLPSGYYKLQSLYLVKQNNYTQEVRLQTADLNSPFAGTIGVFFSSNRQSDLQTLEDPLLPQLTQTYFHATVAQVFHAPMLSPTESYLSHDSGNDKQKSVFGEASYQLPFGLKATAGIRYAATTFDYTGFQQGPWAGSALGIGANGSQSEHPVTPKFALSYKLNDANLFYASASKGFRVGGANKPIPVTTNACRANLAALGLSSAPASYNSDNVWSYEVGAKNGGLNGRLQVNSSLYYIRWSDIQQSVSVPSCAFSFVSNLGSAISKGGDVDAQFRVTSGLTLGVSAAYTDAYYSKSFTAGKSSVVRAGDALPSTPWTVSTTGEYRFNIVAHDSFVRLTYTFDSHLTRRLPTEDAANQSYNRYVISSEPVRYTTARVGTNFASCELSLYADNLFNEAPLLDRRSGATGVTLFNDTTLTPRTIGVRATFRY